MSKKTVVNLLEKSALLPVNCRICAGQLVNAVNALCYGGSVPDGIIFAAYAKSADRFFLCNNKTAYVSGNGKDFIMFNPLAGETPFMVEEISDGVPRAVIINGNKAVMHTGASLMGFQIDVSLSCGLFRRGRLFGADSSDKTLLRWSGEGGVRDWEEKLNGSGSLKLDPERGEILNLTELGGKLIIVRKYGLTIAEMYGSPENFSVEITDTDTDEIYKNTAKAVGGGLLFYTSSGLHRYDGSTVKKIGHRLEGDLSSPVCAEEFAGRYYLACKSKTLSGGAVFCYCADDGESYLIDIAADGICKKDGVYVYNSSGMNRLEEGGNYRLETGEVNFGFGGRKTVTKIFADTAGADVEISNGRVSRKFKNASGVIRPNLRGESFTFKVGGSNPVYTLTATAEAANGI